MNEFCFSLSSSKPFCHFDSMQKDVSGPQIMPGQVCMCHKEEMYSDVWFNSFFFIFVFQITRDKSAQWTVMKHSTKNNGLLTFYLPKLFSLIKKRKLQFCCTVLWLCFTSLVTCLISLKKGVCVILGKFLGNDYPIWYWSTSKNPFL